MQRLSPNEARYDGPTIFFHWVTVLLLAEQWLGAHIIDWFPRGALRVNARSVHIVLGVTLALLLLARILWRVNWGRHLPRADAGILGRIAQATHWGLYFLLVAMVLDGLALTWVRGDSIFNLFIIPSGKPGGRELVHEIREIHAVIGWFILGLAGLHGAAAVVHRYVWNDAVLSRMLRGD